MIDKHQPLHTSHRFARRLPDQHKDDITMAFPELRLYCLEIEEELDIEKSASRSHSAGTGEGTGTSHSSDDLIGEELYQQKSDHEAATYCLVGHHVSAVHRLVHLYPKRHYWSLVASLVFES